jgi:hypothetical protein
MILVKTELGHQVLKDRSVPLSPQQRAAFILVDGRRSVDAILAATAAAGVTIEDMSHLLQVGVAREVPASAHAETMPAPLEARPISNGDDTNGEGRASPPERYRNAYPIATQLTAALGLRGFRLNLSVEAARSYEDLLALAPKIRDAVGAEGFEPLRKALKG